MFLGFVNGDFLNSIIPNIKVFSGRRNQKSQNQKSEIISLISFESRHWIRLQFIENHFQLNIRRYL